MEIFRNNKISWNAFVAKKKKQQQQNAFSLVLTPTIVVWTKIVLSYRMCQNRKKTTTKNPTKQNTKADSSTTSGQGLKLF